MPRKKKEKTPPPAPVPPPDLENRPSASDGMAWINAQYAKIEAMLTILLVKIGISDGERINQGAMTRFIEENGKTYEEHSERDLRSNAKAWTCTCEACGVFRIVKIREVFGYMREVQQLFDEQWDELGRIARERDAELKSWGALARFAPENYRSAADKLEKFAHDLLASRDRQMSMLGGELRLLTAPLRGGQRQ